MMMRQGDLFFAAVDRIPDDARGVSHRTLAEGEITGHTHRIAEAQTADVFHRGSEFFVRVPAGLIARVIHEEHATIDLPPGLYRVWRQREYTPTEIRRVMD